MDGWMGSWVDGWSEVKIDRKLAQLPVCLTGWASEHFGCILHSTHFEDLHDSLRMPCPTRPRPYSLSIFCAASYFIQHTFS